MQARKVFSACLAAMAVMALVLSAGPAPAQDYLKQANDLFAQRADLAKAAQAAGLYEKALQADPKNEEAAWRLARVQYWIGKHQKTDDEKIAAFEKGIAAAKKAIAINPNSIGGHYWLGVSYALYGKAKGITKSLSLIDPIKEQMAAVIKLDPSYDKGGAYRVLGRLYFKLPGLFGGSNSTAIKDLKAAIKYGPDRWLNHLYLAEVYLDEGENDKAKELLNKIIAGPPEPGLEPDWAEEKARAQQLLKEMD